MTIIHNKHIKKANSCCDELGYYFPNHPKYTSLYQQYKMIDWCYENN